MAIRNKWGVKCNWCGHEPFLGWLTPSDANDFHEREGWAIDRDADLHYCPGCVPQIFKKQGREGK